MEVRAASTLNVAVFDESVSNYYKTMDAIAELCGEDLGISPDENAEIKSSFSFFKKWKQFQYSTQNVNFSDGICLSEKVSLPPFSSAAIPHVVHGNANSPLSFRDFIFNVGGSVWALDWCPKLHSEAVSPSKCEFVAVAVHPPESSYHKIGAPLHGLGIVQIWCIISTRHNNEESLPTQDGKRRRKTVEKPKNTLVSVSNSRIKRPRGRPRKKQLVDQTPELDKKSSEYYEIIDTNVEGEFGIQNDNHVSLSSKEGQLADNSTLSKANNSSVTTWKGRCDSEFEEKNSLSDSMTSKLNKNLCLSSSKENNDMALPLMVMCLVHEGRVVWDLKWKGKSMNHCSNHYQMGYLAVLLGSGSLEVWEIPSPSSIKKPYFSSSEEGLDPRFLKPITVFKCSLLKCGNVQSIPLTVEWSSSDDVLVGCHDGTVAVWKFSPSANCDDTMPFLCFSADSLPIRAVAWNPLTENEENKNVILTSGHGGLKFWDIRDPFRPLCDFHPVPRFIYSVDWVPDPNCVMSAYDDGTIRLQSFIKSGFHTLNCASAAIWSVHVSKATDMVAYCSADGRVGHFKLNRKAVEKCPSRNKMEASVCGRVSSDEDGCLTVHALNGGLLDDGNTNAAPIGMPSKNVAMQRVRWNPNAGSERWLCSAGASGVVLCQHTLPF